MKKLLLIFTIAFLLGCLGDKSQSNDISFDDEYKELKSTEGIYDLNNITGINSFESYLSDSKFNLELKNGENASAMLKFIEFRNSLLNAQKNILLAGNELETEINCNETQRADYVIEKLESAISYINTTISNLNEFKSSYPEFVEKTGITEETTENLEFLSNQTKETLQNLQTEINASCE